MAKLSTDPTKPSSGNLGPVDTTDPTERASSITPAPSVEALATGTVNAVGRVPDPLAPSRDGANDRLETYSLLAPNGSTKWVTRNIETGQQSLSDARPL